MLLLFMDIFGGSIEGGEGLEQISHRYGISLGTVSKYFRHASFSLYRSLDTTERSSIRWPSSEEREAVDGLVIEFPQCVFFVDGNKSKRWRPNHNEEQGRAYDGYKKAHVWSVLVYCNFYGRFIRIEISDKGAESDRSVYSESEVYKYPSTFLSPGQHRMAEMGFAGDGYLVVPCKTNESTTWMYRTLHNRYIRKQRMVNE